MQNLSESDIISHDANPDRHPGLLEKKIVDLRSALAEKQDEAAAAIEKMRRAEMVAADAQREIASERQSIVQLHKDKVTISTVGADSQAMLEKSFNDLRMKLVDLETRSYKSGSGEGNFLVKRIQEVPSCLSIRADCSWNGSSKIGKGNFPENLERIAILNERLSLSSTN